MANRPSQPAAVWYKNPWFILACIAVIGFIGTQAGPDDSAASPAPVVIQQPAPVVQAEPAPAPEPTIEPQETVISPQPITNNNVIVLGQADAHALLQSLPEPAAAPRRSKPKPAPAPEVPKPQPANQSVVQPACLPQMIAHHERVAEFYRRMSEGR